MRRPVRRPPTRGFALGRDLRTALVIGMTSVISFVLLLLVVRAAENSNVVRSNEIIFSKEYNALNEIPKGDSNFSNAGKVTILLWDWGTPFGWGDGQVIDPPNYGGFRYEKETCPVQCEFTTDRRLLPTADALLFDPCLTGPDGYRDIPVYMPDKLPGQPWGWFAYEQQYYFPMLQERDYMDRFDYKMTYHHDSQVQITFACPWGGQANLLADVPKKDNKKIVAFFASNCETGGADDRTAYVQELMNYIQVDSYGACLHNKDSGHRGANGANMKQKNDIIGEYKFLLAFENNNKVNDYVTEKLINAYQAGTVPVYWGAPNVDMWQIAPNSMIKTTDYKSPKELAEYLKYLNENDDKYYKYFEWKKTGISDSFKRLWDNCLFFAECRLCKYIAQERSKSTDNFRTFGLPESGVIGYALRINGLDTDLDKSDDYVEVQQHTALNLENSYTLMVWIKLDMITDGRIIDKNYAGQLAGYELDVYYPTTSSGKGVLRLCAGGGCFLSQRGLSLGIWYHVAATFGKDSSSRFLANFYVNGKHDSVHYPTEATRTNSLPLRFGRAAAGGSSWRPHHASTVFDGTIDEISIWGRVLAEKEIFNYMFLRPTGKEAGLVGWWGFNEGTGEVIHDAGPNKLHGTIHGSPTWVVSVSKPVLDPSNIERRRIEPPKTPSN